MHTMQHEMREDLNVRRALVLGTAIFAVMVSGVLGAGRERALAEDDAKSCLAPFGTDADFRADTENAMQIEAVTEALIQQTVAAAETGNGPEHQRLTSILLTQVAPVRSIDSAC